ncbi:MAG: filamentous hemagglutinin N-terminal domain-containing protein, partial [Waterburya sp.]
MTLQGSKLIRQLTFHYQSQIHLSKRHKIISIFRRLSFSLVCSVALFPASALAQITPDGSVPTTVEQLEEIMRINGGEREGNNLFHSFDEFSIPEGMEAIFENSTDIENIFTRVTGDEVSNIDGILSTQGDANFFFINPNGIVFGDNASLNVGGSFIASSAESIQFENGSQFSATNPDQPILDLTGFPTGLGVGNNPGAITVNGIGNQITSTLSPTGFGQEIPTGLSVDTGNTLALVGGEITFNRGVVSTQGGQLYLTSVDSGLVVIDQTGEEITFKNDSVSNFQDITLNEQSLVSSFSEGEGSIIVDGRNVTIADGSFILSQNPSNSSGGAVNITASESLTLLGKSPDDSIFSSIRTETLGDGTGQGGDITVFTPKIVMNDEARIQASTTNDAIAGDIKVNASESINLTGASFSSATFSNGKAGNINVITSELEIADAGRITSASFGDEAGEGNGDGGQVNVTADSIKVMGGSTIERSSIASSTFTAGNAGSVTIDTRQLQVKDGASVSSSTFATGNAGNLSINASEAISVQGTNEKLIVTDNTQSYIRTSSQTSTPEGQDRLNLPEVPISQSGNLTINTPKLTIFNEGTVSVENEGIGDAGTLSINAEDINLDSTGSISATAASGTGGNINIDTDNLQLDNGSQITAEAGNNGNGGNITINTSNLTAKKNSNLTTSAVGGDGGNIDITADTILGLENSD